MSDDVAVVGVGIHPFGRHEGVVRPARWPRIAARARARRRRHRLGGRRLRRRRLGRRRATPTPSVVGARPHRRAVHQRQERLRDRRLGARPPRTRCSPSGAAEVALVVGFDKHPPGAFNPLPEDWGIGSWYGETGLMLTTQFFAMKIQRYMAEHGDQRVDAGQGRREGVRERRAATRTPGAASRSREDEVLASKMVNHPLTQYMFCSPGEGAVALVLARGARMRASSRARRSTCARSRSARAASAPSRSSARRSRSSRRRRRRPRRRRRRSSRPASAPRTSTSPSCRTPSPAPRSCTSPRPACASTASRRR